MSSIGSIGSSGMQRPDPMGMFKKTDSDGSGGVSQAELKSLAEAMQEKTGKTLDVSSDSFNSYDSNGDGSLSGDELKTVLDNSGFGPDQGMQGMGPPPPPPQQATDSYSANSSSSEQDTVSALISNLQALVEKLSANSSQNGAQGTQGTPQAGKQGGPPPPPPPPADNSSSSDSSSTTQIYDAMDTNKDGNVSITELMTALKTTDSDSSTLSDSSTDTSQTGSSSWQNQIKDLNKLMETLSKYADSKDMSSNPLISITS